jgi:hypothetical protein
MRGTLHDWLSSYLSNKEQCVVIQGHKAIYRDVHVSAGSLDTPDLY